MNNLGSYDIDRPGTNLLVLCNKCAKALSDDGWMPELVERGGWLVDESCDRCGSHDDD